MEQKEKLDKDVTLHYIDKLHATLLETGKSLNGVDFALTSFSIILIALSLGLATMSRELGFDGLNLAFSFWLVINGLAWLILVFAIYSTLLLIHVIDLQSLIEGLYSSIGYDQILLEEAHLLTIPHPQMLANRYRFYINESRFDKRLYASLSILFSILTRIMPLLAEIVAFIKIVSLFGFIWWGGVPLLLYILVSVGFSTSSYLRLRRILNTPVPSPDPFP